MTTYVINPITNELENAQPRQRVADKFKLEDLLTPGPLKDELKGDFDPTQETYEEYLRRINLRKGGRVNFNQGGIKITKEVFENLYKNFTGRNKEFAALLNEQGYVTATGKEFSDINVSEYVGYYNLERKPRGGKIFLTTQKKLDKLDQLIVEANNSYTKTPTLGELVKKSGFVKSGKISDISKDGPAQSLVREKLKKLLTTNQKMENYINNVMLSEDALVKDFYAPSEHIRKKFNISSAPYAKFMKNSKAIANNKELFLNLGRVQSFNKYGFNPDGSSKTVLQFSETITNRVPFSAGFGALREDNATSFILKSAVRNHYKSIAAGKTPKVTFVTNPDITPVQDLQFIDNKSGKLFSVDPSIENVEFRGKTYKNNFLNNVNASKLYSKEFRNVYKIYDNDIPKYLNATVVGPDGNRVTLDSLLRKRNYERTGSKNFLTRRAAEIDHVNLIDDPFGRTEGNIRLIDRITNVQAGGIKQGGDVARGKNPKLLKKRLDAIGYSIKDKNVEAFIKRLAKNYDNQNQTILGRRTQELAEKRKAADPYFKKSTSQKPPITISNTLEISGVKSKGMPKLLKALKAAKPVLKSLPVIGTGIGLYDLGKAAQAGVRNPLDLYAAYEVSADVAQKQKAIREDPTGELLQEEIAALPEIVSDDQILDSLGAMQERENFQDGTPPIIPGNEPDYSELQVMMDNPNEYSTFPKGTFAEELDKAVYGTDDEKTLMQRFNQMFLDPRAYPYYVNKAISGAANIPEFAFRTVPALATLGSETVADLAADKYPEGKLQRFGERISPKITEAAKEKVGLTGLIEEGEKNLQFPSTQEYVGDSLQILAEFPGPITPFVFFRAAPKILSQIQNLGLSATAIEKLNKKLEQQLSTPNQSRRDFLITTGAGGAVALLKFLGLDKLVGTGTKVAEKAVVKSGGTPKYFFDFVDLIKRKGKDVSDAQSVVERQKVIEYKDYTLTDTDGYVTIRKTDEDMGRDEMMEYKPSEGVVDEATGKSTEVPAQYDEVTARPDANDPGNFDADSGFESIDDVLEELAKDGKKYTVKELEEMGINLGGISKTEMAEGGIIAGVKSGPAPKSGPTPHGLPYLAKNVTPIKERK